MVLEGRLTSEIVWTRCLGNVGLLSLLNLKKERKGKKKKKPSFIKENFVFLNSGDQTGYNGVFVKRNLKLLWAPPPLPGPLPRGGSRCQSLGEAAGLEASPGLRGLPRVAGTAGGTRGWWHLQNPASPAGPALDLTRRGGGEE